jgi:hypothetical protein
MTIPRKKGARYTMIGSIQGAFLDAQIERLKDRTAINSPKVYHSHTQILVSGLD